MTTTHEPVAAKRSNRLVQIASSPRFVAVTVVVFVLCGIAFAVLIRWGALFMNHSGILAVGSQGVVPDEDRHIGSILYYLNRGWWRGPVIGDFDERYLILGDLQRSPSYLYYWVMSIPASALHLFTTDYNVTVIFLRIVNVLIGAFGLLVTWKTLLMARVHPGIAGVAVLGLSLTGRYLWQSAGVSYDIPSTVLFFLFLYASVAVITRNSTLQLVMMLNWAALVSITKYTFLPFAAVGVVIVVVIYLRRNRPQPVRHFFADARDELRRVPGRFITALVVLVVSAALFCERIIGNLIVYRSVEPACTDVHSATACASWAIFRRNEAASAAYSAHVAAGGAPAQYSPFLFTGEWLDRYYKSMYFYYGRTTGGTISTLTLRLVAIAIVVLIILLIINRTPVFPSLALRVLAIIACAYALGTYLVNLRTYIRYEQYFAFQGRYLLPILVIVYVAVLTLMANNLSRLRGRWRWIVGVPLGVLFLAIFVSHISVIGFFEYAADTHWGSIYAMKLGLLPRH